MILCFPTHAAKPVAAVPALVPEKTYKDSITVTVPAPPEGGAVTVSYAAHALIAYTWLEAPPVVDGAVTISGLTPATSYTVRSSLTIGGVAATSVASSWYTTLTVAADEAKRYGRGILPSFDSLLNTYVNANLLRSSHLSFCGSLLSMLRSCFTDCVFPLPPPLLASLLYSYRKAEADALIAAQPSPAEVIASLTERLEASEATVATYGLKSHCYLFPHTLPSSSHMFSFLPRPTPLIFFSPHLLCLPLLLHTFHIFPILTSAAAAHFVTPFALLTPGPPIGLLTLVSLAHTRLPYTCPPPSSAQSERGEGSAGG